MTDEEGNVQFTNWPIALPHTLAERMLAKGFRKHFGNADSDYWTIMSERFGVERPVAPDAIGLQFFGDEAEMFESEQWMVLTWSSENSPHWKHSLRSRFLICALPASRYAFAGKENLTLQQAVRAIVQSFNHWATHPIHGLAAQVCCIKGDWKFLGQLLNLRNKPDTNACCFLCPCTKDLQIPFTDIGDAAAWRCTPPSKPPCFRAPPIVDIRHFSLALVGLDLLHMFWLGVGRDLVASVLVILLRSGAFAGNNVWASVNFTHSYICIHGSSGQRPLEGSL